MSNPSENISVPSADYVRGKLAEAVAEVRFLRRLLRLAKDGDEANRLRGDSKGTEAEQ